MAADRAEMEAKIRASENKAIECKREHELPISATNTPEDSNTKGEIINKPSVDDKLQIQAPPPEESRDTTAQLREIDAKIVAIKA